MKKSAWIGLGVWVIDLFAQLASSAYPDRIKPHPYVISGIGIMGLVLVLYGVISSAKERGPEATTVGSGNLVGGDNTGKMISHVENYHEASAAPEWEDPKPNLVLSNPEPCRLRFDGFCWRVGGLPSVPGAIFWIHNKPAEKGGKNTGDAYAVSVSLTFRDGAITIAHMSRSCWIDCRENAQNIKASDRYAVLIATFYGLALKAYENKTELDTSVRLARSVRNPNPVPVVRVQDVNFGRTWLIEIDAVVLCDGETLAERKFSCIKSSANELTII